MLVYERAPVNKNRISLPSLLPALHAGNSMAAEDLKVLDNANYIGVIAAGNREYILIGTKEKKTSGEVIVYFTNNQPSKKLNTQGLSIVCHAYTERLLVIGCSKSLFFVFDVNTLKLFG